MGELRKGEEFPSDMNVYQQLLEDVTTERDELKRSLERVSSVWRLLRVCGYTIAVEVFALLSICVRYISAAC